MNNGFLKTQLMSFILYNNVGGGAVGYMFHRSWRHLQAAFTRKCVNYSLFCKRGHQRYLSSIATVPKLCSVYYMEPVTISQVIRDQLIYIYIFIYIYTHI
jgi:hypothetical protein